MHAKSLQSCSTLCDSRRLLCPWNSPGKNTGVGCHFLLQGISPTQDPNSRLLFCGQILYHCATWEPLTFSFRSAKEKQKDSDALPTLALLL